MKKTIVFVQSDGAVWLYNIDDQAGAPRLENETDAGYIERMVARRMRDCEARNIPKGARVATLDFEEVPLLLRTTFKGGRRWDGAAVVPDMTKCRDIRREHFRELRKPLLTTLDVAYMRADEVGDAAAKADIAARKQALRDVMKDVRIESATTPDKLKAVIPDILK